ncbi:Splicing factor 3B subunit 5/RDS3 complex subunit 10 like protein, partial [Aduncisulcus paluster]
MSQKPIINDRFAYATDMSQLSMKYCGTGSSDISAHDFLCDRKRDIYSIYLQ